MANVRSTQQLIEVVQNNVTARGSQQLLEVVQYQSKGVRATQHLFETVQPAVLTTCRDTQEIVEVLVLPPEIRGARNTQETLEVLVQPWIHASQMLLESITRLQYDMDPIYLELSVDEHPRLNLQVESNAIARKTPRNIL